MKVKFFGVSIKDLRCIPYIIIHRTFEEVVHVCCVKKVDNCEITNVQM